MEPHSLEHHSLEPLPLELVPCSPVPSAIVPVAYPLQTCHFHIFGTNHIHLMVHRVFLIGTMIHHSIPALLIASITEHDTASTICTITDDGVHFCTTDTVWYFIIIHPC